MPSSISSSEDPGEPGPQPGQGPNAHHGPLAPGLRLTASDRPGIAQPVPERDVPPLPWARLMLIAALLVIALSGAWEWRMRSVGYEVGDLGIDPSAWAEQRRRIETGEAKIAILGDSRILFDTDLDRFQQLTGVRPVQLAIEGTNARPVLEDIANRSSFNGLVIVGIADQSYFRKEIGLGGEALKRGEWEAPGKRVSFVLWRALRRHLAMLDNDGSLSKVVARADPNWRKGARGPYNEVWKLAVTHDDRQTWMWPRIEHNEYLRKHAIGVWMVVFNLMVPTPDVIAMTQDKTRAAVTKIRARGGDVVFVRPPSAPQLRAVEDKHLPRASGWDALLQAAQVKGVHADDLPDAHGLTIPELSHLNRACATVFTDAYVRALSGLTPKLRIAPDAPSPLHPAQCSAGGHGT
jgi:hypothetical protein